MTPEQTAMEQFQEAKVQAKQLLEGATPEECFEMGFWKGRLVGIESTIRTTSKALNGELADESEATPAASWLSPEDAARLENVTIGETLRHGHLASVLRAQKQVS